MGQSEDSREDERDAIALRARLIREARRREVAGRRRRCASCGGEARDRPRGVGLDTYCESCLLAKARALREKKKLEARSCGG